MSDISDLRDKFLLLVKSAETEEALERVRISALGKKGEISLKMRELGTMSMQQRQEKGPVLNALKDEINNLIKILFIDVFDVFDSYLPVCYHLRLY